MKARVLLVHGLWMQAPALFYWAWRLRKAGFEPVYFSYKSLLQGPDSARVRLRQAALERPDTHILAHSLGGLVTLNALAGEQSFNGRIICVGSPLAGSRTARALASHHAGRLAGHSLPLLCQGLQRVPEGLKVSVIAGTKPNGLGRLLQRFDEPSDGTVALSETKIPGLERHITVPVSHSGQLFSKTVVDEVLGLLNSLS
ncbi:MAG: alpha/beta hydrolase [Arenimonas sp.]|nr:alpha/beta hydrolase [Arenimonas sp.]